MMKTPLRTSNTRYSNGGDDHHGFDVIPYEITCNFDNAMKLAASKKIKTLDPKKPGRYFFFEGGDEMFCYKAEKRFGDLGQHLRDEGKPPQNIPLSSTMPPPSNHPPSLPPFWDNLWEEITSDEGALGGGGGVQMQLMRVCSGEVKPFQ